MRKQERVPAIERITLYLLVAVMSILSDLSSWAHDLRRSALRLSAEEDREPREWTQDGVNIRQEFYHAHWNGSDTRWRILFDGFDFALERQIIGGGLLSGGISTHYWVWLDLPLKHATACLRKAGLKPENHLMEEFYPTENGPERWNACVDDFADVVRLWKVWDKTYRSKTVQNNESQIQGFEPGG